MLILMGGCNIIKVKVAVKVERGADAELKEHLLQTQAFLFVGTKDDGRCAPSRTARIAYKADVKCVSCAVTESADRDRIWLVGTKLLLYGVKELSLFPVKPY